MVSYPLRRDKRQANTTSSAHESKGSADLFFRSAAFRGRQRSLARLAIASARRRAQIDRTSKLRRPFLYDRYTFVTVILLSTRSAGPNAGPQLLAVEPQRGDPSQPRLSAWVKKPSLFQHASPEGAIERFAPSGLAAVTTP